MAWREATEMATLHLHREANYWWFQGMKILGHDQLTTYDEFKRRLIYRFERRDTEISFREFVHANQKGTLEAYISEFQKLVFMVTDILES